MSTLLDTSVLCELLRAVPEPMVLAWFEAHPSETLFVSAVTHAAMMLGARLLPAGKRRASVQAALGAMFGEDFAGRILPFDSAAVAAYLDIVSGRRAAGRGPADLAAIALHAGARLATRNVSDFENCGVAVVNLWMASHG